MGGKEAGIAAAVVGAPVVAVIIWLVWTRQEQMDTQQHLETVKHELRQEKFDRKFDQAWKGLGYSPVDTPATASDREQALEKQRDELETAASADRTKTGAMGIELENAVRQAGAANDAKLQEILKERTGK